MNAPTTDVNVELADRLFRAMTDRWSNHIYDWCSEYGEPGYECDRGVALGNYWCRCGEQDDLHDIASHHPRIWALLEAAGYEFEWHDEWMIDHETDKAYRTQGDSYHWRPQVVLGEHDWLTPDSDIEEWLEYAANNADRCLIDGPVTLDDLRAAGWSEVEAGFEAGWHPGQTADPYKISAAFAEAHPDHRWVFILTNNSQFYSVFALWAKAPDEEEEA